MCLSQPSLPASLSTIFAQPHHMQLCHLLPGSDGHTHSVPRPADPRREGEIGCTGPTGRTIPYIQRCVGTSSTPYVSCRQSRDDISLCLCLTCSPPCAATIGPAARTEPPLALSIVVPAWRGPRERNVSLWMFLVFPCFAPSLSLATLSLSCPLINACACAWFRFRLSRVRGAGCTARWCCYAGCPFPTYPRHEVLTWTLAPFYYFYFRVEG